MVEIINVKKLPVNKIFKMISISDAVPTCVGLPGQICYVRATNKLYFYNETAWKLITSAA